MDTSSAVENDAASAGIHRIEFDVDWPPGFVSAFVLTGTEPVLIDAGFAGNGGEETFRAALAELGLTPSDIEHVVITHQHIDHIGMVQTVREAGTPRIYAPASWNERPTTEAEETARCVREAGVPESMVEHIVTEFSETRSKVNRQLNGDWVDEWIADRQQFTVGGHPFTAHRTPGHHRDHLCFVVEQPNERALFSGDMAIPTFRAPVLHAVFQAEQADGIGAYQTGLERLRTLDVEWVYPGHGPVHTELDGAVAMAQRRLKKLVDRTERVLDSTGIHAVTAASERTDDISSGPWVPEAVAALAHLEREGRAESVLEDGVRVYRPVD